MISKEKIQELKEKFTKKQVDEILALEKQGVNVERARKIIEVKSFIQKKNSREDIYSYYGYKKDFLRWLKAVKDLFTQEELLHLVENSDFLKIGLVEVVDKEEEFIEEIEDQEEVSFSLVNTKIDSMTESQIKAFWKNKEVIRSVMDLVLKKHEQEENKNRFEVHKKYETLKDIQNTSTRISKSLYKDVQEIIARKGLKVVEVINTLLLEFVDKYKDQ